MTAPRSMGSAGIYARGRLGVAGPITAPPDSEARSGPRRPPHSGADGPATPRDRPARQEALARSRETTRAERLMDRSSRRFGSRSVRGAGDRAQTVLLLIEQAPCTGACEVPVAPIAALEPVALREQPRRHRAPRPAVEPRQGCNEQGHGIGAQGRGVPAVERALAAGTGEVGANDESIGVREMKGTQHREPLDECPEGEAP